MDEMLSDENNFDELLRFKFYPNLPNMEEEYDNMDCGCTANVILISGNDLYNANSGDSRSVISEDGIFIELSQDHKPDLEKEQERIKKAGGQVLGGRVNGDLSVSRAIGDFIYKGQNNLGLDEQIMIVRPDVTHKKLTEKSEFVLMGCDGIWETRTTEKIMNMVLESIQTRKVGLTRIIERLLNELIGKNKRGEKIFFSFRFILF